MKKASFIKLSHLLLSIIRIPILVRWYTSEMISLHQKLGLCVNWKLGHWLNLNQCRSRGLMPQANMNSWIMISVPCWVIFSVIENNCYFKVNVSKNLINLVSLAPKTDKHSVGVKLCPLKLASIQWAWNSVLHNQNILNNWMTSCQFDIIGSLEYISQWWIEVLGSSKEHY